MDAVMNLEDEKRELIKKCLSGTATDSELHQYEKLMEDESLDLSDLAESLTKDQGDSFIETIHQFSTADTDKISKLRETDPNHSKSLSRLVNRIQQLVPQKKASQEDLDRILSESSNAESLGKIDRYEVVEFLASGGMGIVFKAIDPTLDRFVCIKVLNPNLKSNVDAKTRFERETKSAAQLRSERIVMVLEVGEHRELPYFVMQLLDGETLRSKINSGTIAPETARQFVVQIAEGLRHAHSLGILHRDIKPENIWITPESNIKLLDFGLAQVIDDSENLTHTGTIIGTPAYMSPEQVQGKPVDQRSDLFSVGIIFYEMQMGISPFVKPNLFSTLMSVANDEIEFGGKQNADKPNCEFTSIIKSLLEKKPAERIQSADELIERLDDSFESVISPSVVPSETKIAKKDKVQSSIPKSKAPDTQASSTPPSVLSRLLYGFGGAAVLLLALLIYQTTDKGTLVVEASSDVEVQIKNEVVKIVDPKNGKKYEIRIGANPLPSGVYQLESTQPDSDLVFSSNVITIRRGAKQLVKVELKPSDPKPTIASNDKPDVKPKSSAGENAKQKTPKRFALSDLPKLDTKQLNDFFEHSDEQPVFKNGIVSKPSKLSTVSTWTIEPANSSIERKCPISVSNDGTMFAMADRRDWIRIWSDKFELLHLLPSIGTTSQIEWSSDGKHLVALCESDGKKKIILWRIEGEYAEVVRVIPTIGEKLSWTESDRYLVLSVPEEKKVEIHDLMPSTPTKRFVGIIGEFQDAAEFGDSIIVASIHNGDGQLMDSKFQNVKEVMTDAESMRFLTGQRMKPELVIRTKEGWKIWSTATKETRSLPNFEQNDMRERLSSDGKHFIKLSADGYIMTRNTKSEKEGSSQIKLPDSEKWRFNQEAKSYAWSSDGTTTVFQFKRTTYVGKLLNNGQFQWSSRDLFSEPVGWHETQFLNDGKMFYSVMKSDDGINSYVQNGIYQTDGKSILTKEKFRLWIQLPSPNGMWFSASAAFIATEGNQSGKLSLGGDKLNIYSLVTGELDHQVQLPANAYNHYWISDSKHIVIQRQKTTSSGRTQIIQGKPGDRNFKNAEYVYSVDKKKLITLIPPDGYRFENPASIELLDQSEANGSSSELVKLVRAGGLYGTYGLARYSLSTENCIEVIDLPQFKSSPKIGADKKHVWVYGTPSKKTTKMQSDDTVLVAFFERTDLNASPILKEFSGKSNSGLYQFRFPFYSVTFNNSTKLRSLDESKKQFNFNQVSTKIGTRNSMTWHQSERNQLINFRKYSSEIECFNFATNSSSVRKHSANIIGVNSTPTGWQIVDGFGLTDVDFTGVIQKYRFTRCAIDDATQTPLDLWITADGKYARRKDADKYYTAVLLRGGRFETRTISEFEKEFQLTD